MILAKIQMRLHLSLALNPFPLPHFSFPPFPLPLVPIPHVHLSPILLTPLSSIHNPPSRIAIANPPSSQSSQGEGSIFHNSVFRKSPERGIV